MSDHRNWHILNHTSAFEIKEESKSQDSIYQKILEGKISSKFSSQGYFFVYGKKESLYDWKIHLSIAPEQVSLAFDLIYPILSKNFSCFKVTRPDYPLDQRCSKGAQITIYLDESFESKTVMLETILREINKILVSNEIKNGVVPRSDALLSVGSFFSLRNDGTKEFEAYNGEGYYFEGHLVGTHYNPRNIKNPYNQLLKSPDKPFDLISFFNEFEPKSLWEVYQAISCTCFAFFSARNVDMSALISQLDYYYLPRIKAVDLKLVCELLENPDSDMDKKRELLRFLKIFKKIDLTLLFSFILGAKLRGLPAIDTCDELKKVSLGQFYLIDDDFKKFLKHVDKVKNQLPLDREDVSLPMYSSGRGVELALQLFRGPLSLLELLEKYKEVSESVLVARSSEIRECLSRLKAGNIYKNQNEEKKAVMKFFKPNQESKDDLNLIDKKPKIKRRYSH